MPPIYGTIYCRAMCDWRKGHFMKKDLINVYDFDKTIYDGDSTADFYMYCLKHHPFIALRWPQLAFYFLLFTLQMITKTAFKEKMYRFLRFVPDVETAIDDFWKTHQKKIKGWYLDQKQDSDLISSASPDFLLNDICRNKLGVRLIASIVDAKTGLYTGLNNHGAEKVKRLNEEYPHFEINNFYSDSLSDAPLAKIAKKSYLVDGDVIKDWPK